MLILPCSLSLSLFSLFLSLSLSFSFSFTLSSYYTYTISLSLCLSFSQTHTLPISLSLSLFHRYCTHIGIALYLPPTHIRPDHFLVVSQSMELTWVEPLYNFSLWNPNLHFLFTPSFYHFFCSYKSKEKKEMAETIVEEVEIPTKSKSLRAKSIQKRLETERNKSSPRGSRTRNCNKSSKSGGRKDPNGYTMSKYRRRAANAKERDRMKLVNEAFERLRDVVPDVPENPIFVSQSFQSF